MKFPFIIILGLLYGCINHNVEESYFYKKYYPDEQYQRIDMDKDSERFMLTNLNHSFHRTNQSEKFNVSPDTTKIGLTYADVLLPLKADTCVTFNYLKYGSFESCYQKVINDTVINDMSFRKCVIYIIRPKDSVTDIYPQRILFDPQKAILIKSESQNAGEEYITTQELIQIKTRQLQFY